MKNYQDQGHDFIEVDTDEDCPNITVTHKETPIVVVKDNSEKIIINVLTWTLKPVEIHVNNRLVRP